MQRLRTLLLVVLLLGLGPNVWAAPQPDVDSAVERSAWVESLELVFTVVDILFGAVLPDSDADPIRPASQSSEPQEPDTPEAYPLVEPVG